MKALREGRPLFGKRDHEGREGERKDTKDRRRVKRLQGNHSFPIALAFALFVYFVVGHCPNAPLSSVTPWSVFPGDLQPQRRKDDIAVAVGFGGAEPEYEEQGLPVRGFPDRQFEQGPVGKDDIGGDARRRR